MAQNAIQFNIVAKIFTTNKFKNAVAATVKCCSRRTNFCSGSIRCINAYNE